MAARLEAAMAFREIGIGKLAGMLKKSRNTVARHVHPEPSTRPVTLKARRQYERVLRLPALCLDSGTPQQLVGMLENVPQRVSEPPQAPFAGQADTMESVMGFIRSQLLGYQARAKPIAPQVVMAWLDDLEGAISATARVPTIPAGGAGSAARGVG